MNKHIVFDFDGTIVNSMGQAVQLYNEIAGKYNLRVLKEEDLIMFSKLTIPQRIKMFEVPLYMIPKIAIEFKRNYQRIVSTLQEIVGMKEIIRILKEKGYSLIIISSNSVSNIQQFLNNNDLNVFDHIFSAKGLFGKQSTISSVSKKLKINKEDMIYIGDELRDIVSCKKAEVEIIAVTWGFDSYELLSDGKPDYIANTPDDILSIMQEITAQKSV
jgi:phosphoglycolate phosphatase